jgi:hypothetical protein
MIFRSRPWAISSQVAECRSSCGDPRPRDAPGRAASGTTSIGARATRSTWPADSSRVRATSACAPPPRRPRRPTELPGPHSRPHRGGLGEVAALARVERRAQLSIRTGRWSSSRTSAEVAWRVLRHPGSQRDGEVRRRWIVVQEVGPEPPLAGPSSQSSRIASRDGAAFQACSSRRRVGRRGERSAPRHPRRAPSPERVRVRWGRDAGRHPDLGARNEGVPAGVIERIVRASPPSEPEPGAPPAAFSVPRPIERVSRPRRRLGSRGRRFEDLSAAKNMQVGVGERASPS